MTIIVFRRGRRDFRSCFLGRLDPLDGTSEVSPCFNEGIFSLFCLSIQQSSRMCVLHQWGLRMHFRRSNVYNFNEIRASTRSHTSEFFKDLLASRWLEATNVVVYFLHSYKNVTALISSLIESGHKFQFFFVRPLQSSNNLILGFLEHILGPEF